MAYLFGSSEGGSFVDSVVANVVYDPVYGDDTEMSFIWNVLPSWYRELMNDRDEFEALWKGVSQEVSHFLLYLYHLESSAVLKDAPVISQHKWIELALLQEIDFAADPVLNVRGREGRFAYDAAAQLLDATWVARVGISRATEELRSALNEDCSLEWSWRTRVDSIQKRASALWGYTNSTNTTSTQSAVVAGIYGFKDTTDTPRAVILHVSPQGVASYAVSTVDLSIAKTYEFRADYSARTETIQLDVFEVDYVKVAGTGTAEGVSADLFVNQIRGESSFEGVVAVGDFLSIDSGDYAITSVDGDLLTVGPFVLPAAAAVPFEVKGLFLVDSLAMVVPAVSPDPTFAVDEFGTMALDVGIVTSVFFENPGKAANRGVVGATWQWSYLDPTVSELIIALPELRATLDASAALYEGTDFTLIGVADLEGNLESTTIAFQEPPGASLWAEYVGYDEFFLRDFYGNNVSLMDHSSEGLKSRIRGLYYAYFRGPTRNALRTGVHLLLDLPIADAAGSVESINPVYSGTHGEMVVAGKSYLYPLNVGTDLLVGDEVALFQPLSNGVEIVDWKTNPRWWLFLSSFNELQKFNTFGLRADIAAIDVAAIEFVQTFLDNIKPTWKDYRTILFREGVDDVDIDDDLVLGIAIGLFDYPCDVPVIMYDADDYEPPLLDWMYDQGQTEWDDTTPAIRASLTVLDGTAALTNSDVNGIGTSTDWETSLGIGALTDVRVGAALVTTGTAGVTQVGSNRFTDPTASAFADVLAGDTIVITGEGTFEVTSVTDDNELFVDSPLVAANTGVNWTTTGQYLYWGTVDSTSSDTALIFDTAFAYDTGTYKLGLIDNDYFIPIYDKGVEECPEETLGFVAQLSTGYQETLLAGTMTFDDGSTTVEGVGTDFVNEIGGPGAVTDKYLSTPNGHWYLVASVTDADTLVLDSAPDEDESAVVSHLADEVPAGTFTFNAGSPTVTASSSQTGVIAANDYIQVVPAVGATPFTDYPVVEVLSIDGPGTTITLTANYSGVNATTEKTIRRGAGAVLPLSVTLPTSKTATVAQDITAWQSAAGDSVSTTVTEP